MVGELCLTGFSAQVDRQRDERRGEEEESLAEDNGCAVSETNGRNSILVI